MYFPRGFDHEKAIELGKLVRQAYGQLDAFQNEEAWSLGDGYTMLTELVCPRPRALRRTHSIFDREIEEMGRSSARAGRELPVGFIASRGPELFLVFRGTMTIEEWIRNLRFTLAPYILSGMGKVHEGFLLTYGLIRQRIQETLAAQGRGKRLFIAGHSLGGALATLAAPDVSQRTPFQSPVVYTYGSPRVGDREFAEAWNSAHAARAFRIANTSDIVPSIPLPVPFAGLLGGFFTHVETPVDFTTQEENLEKNHGMAAYLAALDAGKARKGFLETLFGQA